MSLLFVIATNVRKPLSLGRTRGRLFLLVPKNRKEDDSVGMSKKGLSVNNLQAGMGDDKTF
jgi:hypothetical protein